MNEVQQAPFLEGETLESMISIGGRLSEDGVGIELETPDFGVRHRVVDDELRALLREKDESAGRRVHGHVLDVPAHRVGAQHLAARGIDLDEASLVTYQEE